MIGRKQRAFLLAERWLGPKGAERLAQLLHTIFAPDIPVELDAPLTLTAQPGVPPIQITNWTPGDVLFQVTNQSGDTVTNVTAGEDGLQSEDEDGDPQGEEDQGEQQAGGNFFPAKITSGSGSSYVVSIFANGRGSAATATGVAATHPDIDSGEDIDDDTPCWVVQTADGSYELVGIPTWL